MQQWCSVLISNLLLLALLPFIYARVESCKYEALPHTFSSISYLSLTNEFHVHGEYYVNMSTNSHLIRFSISEESLFRAYLAPHDVDVDLWLYNATSGMSIAHSSLDIGTEEVIHRHLPIGNYYLKLNFFGFIFGDYSPTACDTVTFEATIVPRTRVMSRLAAYTCPPTEVLPIIDSGSLQDIEQLDFTSNSTFNVQTPQNSTVGPIPSRAVRWLTAYNFTLTEIKGKQDLWQFEATIGLDFLSGGTLGMVLLANDGSLPTLRCFDEDNCTSGALIRMNENVLRTMVPAGSYSLWLYDHYGERPMNLTSCIPFTFNLHIQVLDIEENFLTCNYPVLPDTILPGLFDEPTGVLHYSENVLLDLESGGKSMNFYLNAPSFMRVFTAPHRVDIDLQIIDTSDGRVLEYALSWGGGEEAITTFLPAGNYNLSIIFFGIYQYQFCETFYLEIAIAPQFMYQGLLCNSQTPITPDLSLMPSMLQDASHNFTLHGDQKTYVYVYPQDVANPTKYDYSTATFFSQTFNIMVPSTFRARLGKNFLLGDLNLALNDSQGGLFYGSYERNGVYLYAQLSEGQYTFTISTGAIQRYSATRLAPYPSCAEYTLSVEVIPRQEETECFKYHRVPKSLNSVKYLGRTNFVHFDQDFLAPLIPGQFQTSEFMTFSVTDESFFRVWTEPHLIDVDFYLFEDNRQVASVYKWNEEEELIYELQPNHNYTLRIEYYHWSHTDPHQVDPACFLYHMELAITPVTDNDDPITCQDSLPSANYIPTMDGNIPTFFEESRYFFTQKSTGLKLQLPFLVSDFVLFRAEIRYDFVWSDLSLLLIANNQTTTFAESLYNRQYLNTALLGPGYYILEIHEPGVQHNELRRCVSFWLSIGFELQSTNTALADYEGCHNSYFAPTLDAVPFLSPLSGYKIHQQRSFLINTKDKLDTAFFSLQAPSVVGLFIPPHGDVDIDITLRNASNRYSFAHSIGLGAEEILFLLGPGSYFFEFRYYGFRGSTLPSASDCVSFPAEVAIAPVSYLQSIPAFTSACTTAVPSRAMQIDTIVEQNFTRSTVDASFVLELSFTLSQQALLDFDLRYDFLTGGLAMDMLASVDEGNGRPINRTFFSNIGYNHAYFYKALQKGTYTIRIYDFFSISRTFSAANNLKCSSYSISYLVNTTGVPSGMCDDTEALPTDLFSTDGESANYGGPQDPTDGSVRIFGDNFALSDENGKHNFILFNILAPSYVRVFLSTEENDDIDFYVYSNASRPIGSLVIASMGTQNAETKVFRLEPQANPYLLDVYFFSIVAKPEDCPTFHFEMAIKTVDTVNDELRCPNPLPVPEVPPSMLSADSYLWLDDTFVFTSTRMDGNTDVNNVFTYRITLVASYNTTIFSAVGYDFLANNFQLRLSNAVTGELLGVGFYDGEESEDSYINFQNVMWDIISPGTYYLDITEDLNANEIELFECHKFEFFLALYPSQERTPTIDAVRPASGTRLNPYMDLTITIIFSTGISVPAGQSLINFIKTNHAVFLFDTKNSAISIDPSGAVLDSDHMVLGITFSSSNFAIGKSYKLTIDASKFLTSSGTPFTAYTGVNVYTMSDCSCSGHGTCGPSSAVCVCNAGYAGDDCSACASGYHYAGVSCVANTHCTQYTCNLNGQCVDTGGYPQCYCYPGYATSGDNFCTVCAYGYRGYPNCTAVDQGQDRSDRCIAPLVPGSLDSVAYLGYNNEIHLQGNYYIDYASYKHDMYFSLQTDSVLRVYVEPDQVDIDVWLYALKDDGSIDHTIDYGITFNQEEVLFHVLNGTEGSHPQRYMLRFRYFVWGDKPLTDCETFTLELAMKPVPRVQAEAALMAVDCANVDTFPLPPNYDPSVFFTIPQAGFSFTPSSIFTLRSKTNRPPTANYFHSINFQVTNPAGKVALLHAELGYRFLPADLALLLEEGTNKQHCSGRTANCQVGSNLENRNILHKYLLTGNYTLWFYEPEPQQPALTQCSPFTFSFNLTFEDPEEDIYYCDASLLPLSFNGDGFLDDSGYMHIQDKFLLLNDTIVPFTLSNPSFFRIVGSSESSVIAFQLYNLTQGSVVIQSSNFAFETDMFAQLPAGKYGIYTESFFSPTICPAVSIEMAILPVASVSAYSGHCIGTDLLPSLGDIRLPFVFPAQESPVPDSYFALLNNPVIRQWTFVVDQASVLEVMLDSDFLTSALKMELQYSRTNDEGTTTQVSITGDYVYNRNHLFETIEPGSYTLKITKPTSPSSRSPVLPPCAEFNFAMSLQPLSQFTTYPCTRQGEVLPTTFNSMRFLGHTGRFNYQSEMIRVPSFVGFVVRAITFTVPTASFFRVFTEPHVVDIDLSLFEAGKADPVVTGGYELNVEESLVWVLTPNVQYTLELIFWKWQTNLPQCPMFNMEVAIEPAVDLPDQCPNSGADHWPTGLVGIDKLPFFYNNVISQETLYYQQKLNETREWSVTFNMGSRFKFYAALKYVFATGDLVLRLNNTDTGTIYYGDNALNGDILKQVGLQPGQYVLTIYESTLNVPSHMGCSPFDLEVHAEVDSMLNADYSILPQTFDSVPFLYYGGEVHVQDYFTMFEDSAFEDITFTIASTSLLRASTAHTVNSLQSIQVALFQAGNVLTSHAETLLYLLAPGSYVLRFTRPASTFSGTTDGTIVVNVEIAISPSATITRDITNFAQPATCSDVFNLQQITPDPDGYFQYRARELLISSLKISSTNPTIQSVPMTLTKPSAFFAHLGSNFLLSELELEISGTKSNTGESIYVVGRNGRNLNEISELLPAGTYSLKITQRVPFAYTTQFPHCTTFSLRITIQDKENEDHVDCADYNNLPWDLSSENGGSQPYGGPIDGSGSLHMAGSFLMPPTIGEIDTLSLSVTRQSLMSVVTVEYYYGEITYRVQRGTTMKAINPPRIRSSDYNQRAELFLLDHTGDAEVGTSHELQLLYGTTTSNNCPYFDFQVAIQPLANVGRSILCPVGYQSNLPAQTVNTSGIYSEFVDSAFTDTYLSKGNNTYGLHYEIAITVNQTSTLMSSLSFNSLANIFRMELFSANRPTRTRIGASVFQMQKVIYGTTNLNQVITGTLLPGKYVLVISQPNAAVLPFLMSLGRHHCYPFIYQLQIVPQGAPYVSNVEPTSGDTLSPLSPIEIEVSFSTSVYYQSQKVTNSNSDAMKLAFYLRGEDGTNISPSIVDESGGHWRLIFNSSFKSKTAYTLQLNQGILKDGSGNAIVLISTNRYRMIDTTCFGHGAFDSGVCFCFDGYAGTQCDFCDIGYQNKNSQTGVLDCQPVTSPCPTCVHGYCDADLEHCVCPDHWFGPSCDQCAPGWNGPNCDQKDNTCPTCVRGTCNTATGKCDCPDHWAGSVCDECASGWAGDDCNTPSGVVGPPSTIVDDSKWISVLNGVKVAGIIISAILIVSTVGFFIYRRYSQKSARAYNAVFETLDLEESPANELSRLDEDMDEEDFGSKKPASDSSRTKLIALDDD